VERFDYLIIGNSVAAVGAVEAIREVDDRSSLAIVCDEPFHTYSRPRISECLTSGEAAERICYRPREFYDEYSVVPILGVRVEHIIPGDKAVCLSDGRKLQYQKLLLATGSRPIVPRIEGIGLAGVHYFTTYAHVEQLARSLSDIKQAVVIGGGLIGLQAAEALCNIGVEVTVVEKLDRILAQSFDERASALIEAQFVRHGVSIITSASVEAILGDGGRVSSISLSNNESIPCQAVVVAVGVTPRKELAEEAGLRTNRGIVVDDFMRTSDPDVYAAGDVCESVDLLTGERCLMQIWPNAYAEGRIAGLNMAGQPTRYKGGISLNATHFFGYPVGSAGLIGQMEGCLDLVDFDESTGFYRRIITRNGIPIGMVMAGDALDRAGIITAFIRNKTDVSSFITELGDRNFNIAHMTRELRLARQLGREM